MTTRKPHGCTYGEELLAEIAEAKAAWEIREAVWQALILAYLDHNGWREAAEALFVKHGYTPAEIRMWNSCAITEGADK